MEFDVNDFEPGDSFDVPPIYGSKLISAIMGIGGEVYLDGNTVVIVSLPGKTFAPPTSGTKYFSFANGLRKDYGPASSVSC